MQSYDKTLCDKDLHASMYTFLAVKAPSLELALEMQKVTS